MRRGRAERRVGGEPERDALVPALVAAAAASPPTLCRRPAPRSHAGSMCVADQTGEPAAPPTGSRAYARTSRAQSIAWSSAAGPAPREPPAGSPQRISYVRPTSRPRGLSACGAPTAAASAARSTPAWRWSRSLMSRSHQRLATSPTRWSMSTRPTLTRAAIFRLVSRSTGASRWWPISCARTASAWSSIPARPRRSGRCAPRGRRWCTRPTSRHVARLGVQDGGVHP